MKFYLFVKQQTFIDPLHNRSNKSSHWAFVQLLGFGTWAVSPSGSASTGHTGHERTFHHSDCSQIVRHVGWGAELSTCVSIVNGQALEQSHLPSVHLCLSGRRCPCSLSKPREILPAEEKRAPHRCAHTHTLGHGGHLKNISNACLNKFFSHCTKRTLVLHNHTGFAWTFTKGAAFQRFI